MPHLVATSIYLSQIYSYYIRGDRSPLNLFYISVADSGELVMIQSSRVSITRMVEIVIMYASKSLQLSIICISMGTCIGLHENDNKIFKNKYITYTINN